MFLFDLLKSDDRRLRGLLYVIGSGFFVLLAGLWFVQVVYASRFEQNSRQQSLKHVGIPAIRGRILDRNGRVLADSQPHYNAIVYLEELQDDFTDTYLRLLTNYGRAHPDVVNSKGRISVKADVRQELHREADCAVVERLTGEVGGLLHEQRILNTNDFLKHYTNYPYVPFELAPNLNQQQLARFSEQLSSDPELEIEVQPVRTYPNGSVAAHVLGFVQREMLDSGQVSYALPDYVGRAGIEKVYDDDLRGDSGIKAVLVNSMNYRQSENIESSNAPGDDIYLTLDLPIQEAAEKALATAMPDVRGAAVVVDVRNGDILALVSAPTFDPNHYVAGLTKSEAAELNDPKLKPQINRAIDGAYPPGSTFKAVTAIACLESGLNPEEEFDSPGFYQATPTSHRIADTAVAGRYNFARAFFRSSNTYFIHYGMMAGLPKILEVANRFYLGQKTQLTVGPEVGGRVPRPDQVGTEIHTSSAPDVCIGQEITTTPLQMAMFYAALANGGKIFWPRLISHSYSPSTGQQEQLFAPGRLRGIAPVNPRHLQILRSAMVDDTDHPATGDTREGTAYPAFHIGNRPRIPGFRVAGKTGTAQVKSANENYHIVWFNSYAPYENPRYAVVVMVEGGSSGGGTCAPVAEKIYEAIVKEESKTAGASLARN